MTDNRTFGPVVATHAALFAAAAIVLIPFLWISAAAFKTQIALLTGTLTFMPTLANMNEPKAVSCGPAAVCSTAMA